MVICLLQWEYSPVWRNTGAPLNSNSAALYVLVGPVWWAGGELRILSCFLNTLFSATDTSQDRASLLSPLGSAALVHYSVEVSAGIHCVKKQQQLGLAHIEGPRIFWTTLDFCQCGLPDKCSCPQWYYDVTVPWSTTAVLAVAPHILFPSSGAYPVASRGGQVAQD